MILRNVGGLIGDVIPLNLTDRLYIIIEYIGGRELELPSPPLSTPPLPPPPSPPSPPSLPSLPSLPSPPSLLPSSPSLPSSSLPSSLPSSHPSSRAKPGSYNIKLIAYTMLLLIPISTKWWFGDILNIHLVVVIIAQTRKNEEITLAIIASVISSL